MRRRTRFSRTQTNNMPPCDRDIFGLSISTRNSISHDNERIRITGNCGLGFDSIYADVVNKDATTEQENV